MDIGEWMAELECDELCHIEDSLRSGEFEMYNPTTFERQKENDFVSRHCLCCHASLLVQRKDDKAFCNIYCEDDYAEYGAMERPCADFDAEDNM
jgi:hypothetical protein